MAFNKEKVMEAARKFVDKGQIDKAIKEYLRIVHEDPKDVRVWLKIGDLYAKKGAKQDATETYLKVARFYHEQGFFLKAVAVYKQILKLDPRLVDVNLKLAELYRQLGLMSDAMQHFESVAAHFHREGNTKEALAHRQASSSISIPRTSRPASSSPSCTRRRASSRRRSREFTDRVRAAAPPGPAGRLPQGRRAPAVAQARQPRAQPRARGALPRAATIRGARCRSCRPASRPTRATSRRSACSRRRSRRSTRRRRRSRCSRSSRAIHVENKQRDKAGEVFRKILEFVPTDPDAREFLGPAAVAAPPPPPSAPTRPTPPPSRPMTPLPAQVRGATSGAKFNITGDLPALARRSPNDDRLDAARRRAEPVGRRLRAARVRRRRLLGRHGAGARSARDVGGRRAPRRGDLEDPRRDRRLREVRPAPEGRRSPAPRVRARSRERRGARAAQGHLRLAGPRAGGRGRAAQARRGGRAQRSRSRRGVPPGAARDERHAHRCVRARAPVPAARRADELGVGRGRVRLRGRRRGRRGRGRARRAVDSTTPRGRRSGRWASRARARATRSTTSIPTS